MNTLSIDTGEQTSFRPGEEITVEVSWDLSPAPSKLELRVVWNTSGKGTSDIGVASRTTIEHPSASDRQRVTVSLPEAPYSFSGRIVSVVWALELVALPSKKSYRAEIVIGPNGQEVLATGAPDDASS